MQHIIAVILGSALGGVARFWLNGVVSRRYGETFPWGTMVVNVSGAFLIGVVATLLYTVADQPGPAGLSLWHFLIIGFLGSYTTVSSFSLQTLALLQSSERRQAAINVVMTLLLCLAAVALGYLAGQSWSGAT